MCVGVGQGTAMLLERVCERAGTARDFSTLLVEEREDRVVVRLNRPEVRNAIDQQMVDELHAVCDRLEAVPEILILSGTPELAPEEGPSGDSGKPRPGVFASGADIAELRERRRDDALQGINSSSSSASPSCRCP